MPVVFGISVALVGLLSVKNLTKNPLDILNSSDLDQIATNIPAIKQAIDENRKKVDTLPEPSDPRIASSDYSARKTEVDNSLKLHQHFLQRISDLKEAGKLVDTSREAAQDIETSLAAMILKYRIPFLELDLQQQKFGQLIETSEKTDPPDQQFTPGALRTTYEILMTESGARADLDQNGTIKSPNKANPREANQIPCLTLIKIQDLWKQATNQTCGWYGRDANNPHVDPECEKQLNKANTYLRASTLASIFSENYPDELAFRVKHCETIFSR